TSTVTSQWDGGYVTEYTIANSGTTPLDNWQLQFTLPAGQSITDAWNAVVTQSGNHYVLTPESYDSTIASDGSIKLGFEATDAGAYAPPTQVTVDGQPVDSGSGATSTTTTGTTGATSTTTGTTSTGTTGTTTSGAEFSPYFDVTLYPAFNYSSAADAGIKDATLAFIVADSQDQPAWGGFGAYAVDGGSDISYINNQISAMEADGISPTISFGGENGTYLADVPGQTVSGLENDYLEVINSYDIHKLDFDIEGAELSNTSALKLQAQALAAVESQEAADGTPLTVSYTLPVLPTGLTASGLEPLELAKEYGVDVNVVNIMAMDYGGSFDGGGDPNMGELAIEAAQNTHSQLMQLYPDLSSAQAWSMVGVTPLIGINDDPAEIFTLADAQQLTDFAIQNHLGELSMWAGNKDVEGTLGATDQLDGSGIAQAPWAFSKIFEQFAE
ncbi:cellulose binding domain-containing protein, partial [Mycobacterium sp.]|uniref:cellulose binding domain-containing protein n=1 Tax=Mycobacterium sp. TaxID=1785 RepID=UPI00128888CA